MNANELIATDWQGSDLIEEWEVPESFLLIAFADKVMREMRSESLTRVDPSAYFVAIAGPQDARRFHLPQDLRPLMNSGIAKTILFSHFRQMAPKVQAFVFGSEVWRYHVSPEGEEAFKDGSADFAKLVEQGLAKQTECLLVVAQNKETVWQLCQPFIRNPRTGAIQLCGTPEAREMPQAEYRGRMKMWNASASDVAGDLGE